MLSFGLSQAEEKLRGKKKHAEKVLGESLLEEDPTIVKLKVYEKHAENLGHVDNRI